MTPLQLFIVCLACVLTATAGFWVSFLGTAMMRRVAPRLGLVDQPSARKVHLTPTPLGGGVGIWLGVIVPLGAAQLAAWWLLRERPSWLPPKLLEALENAETRSAQLWVILGAGTVLAVMGLLDDKRPLPWKPRLLIQVLVATVAVLAGVRATLFVYWPWFGGVATVIWFVVLVNSFNFLDNMDGLSGGIAFVVALLFAAIMLTIPGDPRWLVGGFLLIVAGSLFGFLCHNWSPARIFMGDSGSYFIGFTLAATTVLGTWYSEHLGSTHVILAPLCVLAVPLYDITSVVLIRLREGRSPFQADKRHFSHRLVSLGLKPVRAVLTVHLCTLTTGLGGVILYRLPNWSAALLVVALVVCVLAIIAILESAPRNGGRP